MSKVSTYLNFDRHTEEAFNFYKTVFGGEFAREGIMRMGDVPPMEGMPPMTEEDKNLVMHVELETIGGHSIMGTDSPECMGLFVKPGNNMHISLQPDSREEADRLFNGLSAGGKVGMDMHDAFWGAYFGSFTDKYGINWMINYEVND